MKKIINKILPVLVMTIVFSCDTDGGIDNDIFTNGTDGTLASWITSVEGSEKLTLSDPASEISYEIEFIDGDGGNSVEVFTMTVSQTEFAGGNSGVLINQNSFSANSQGNQGFSGTFSLNDVVAALGVAITSLNEEDTLSFESTVTVGGVEYPSGSASTFLNAVQNFDLNVPIETVSITSFTAKNQVINATANTITMTFENDFGIALETLPTISRVSSIGAVDDVIGAVEAVLDIDGEDSVYTFNYTPTSMSVDTVAFMVSGASAFASGFEMESESYTEFFIVDNVIPTTVGDNSGLLFGASGDTTGYRFNRLFSEDIGSITITSDFTGVDDDEDEEIDEAGEASKEDVTFTGNVLDYTFGWSQGDGEVTLVLKMTDVAGNPLDVGDVTIVITPN